MKKVGLHEIAEESGVSHVTVSRILSGKADLHKPETVERVQAVADKMGYRPNILAKSMQTGRTLTIGVILRSSHGSWFSDIQRGIHQGLIAGGYLPITLSVTEDPEQNLEQVHHMLGRRVEGLILWQHDDAVLKESARSGLPIVTIDSLHPAARRFDFVGTDEAFGGQLAARHLLELGHRQVATATFGEFAAMQDRRKAFAAEMGTEADATCRDVTVPHRDYDAIRLAVRELLAGKDRPTAIFAGADRIAWVVMREAEAQGLELPADLSVVGYADLDFASMISPPLTTVRQPAADIGRHAAEYLLDRISGKEKRKNARRLLLKPELTVRESTARLVPVAGS